MISEQISDIQKNQPKIWYLIDQNNADTPNIQCSEPLKSHYLLLFSILYKFLGWIYLGFGHLVRQNTQFEVDTLCSLTCNEHFMLHLPITELVGHNWSGHTLIKWQYSINNDK